MKRNISISLDVEVIEWLENVSSAEDRSVSNLVNLKLKDEMGRCGDLDHHSRTVQECTKCGYVTSDADHTCAGCGSSIHWKRPGDSK